MSDVSQRLLQRSELYIFWLILLRGLLADREREGVTREIREKLQ